MIPPLLDRIEKLKAPSCNYVDPTDQSVHSRELTLFCLKEDCAHYFELFCPECIELGHHLHKPNNLMKFVKKAIEAYEAFKQRAKSSLIDMVSEKK